MSEAILHEILQKLGRIEEKQDRVRTDLDKEQEHARENRAAIHAKLDDLQDRMTKAESSIVVAAGIDVQVRNELNAMKPAIEDFTRMRQIGLGAVGIIALGGTAFGASLIWWGEQMISFIRGLLRVP